MSTPSAAVIVLAGGSGSRVGAEKNKVLLGLDGIAVLAHSVRTALAVEGVHRLVVVVRPEDRDEVSAALAPHIGTHDIWLVDGGAERHHSEYAGLQALRADIEAGEIDVVSVHDAARPLASAALFRDGIDLAHEHGAAIPGLPLPQLNHRDGTRAREALAGMQTPQSFRADALLLAYSRAESEGFLGTDTAACVAWFDQDAEIRIYQGSPRNIKVTFGADLALAAELLTSMPD